MDKNVLKVQLRALTLSFRIIRFQHGYLPSYPIPPISTIYGFLGSALGTILPKSEKPWIGIKMESGHGIMGEVQKIVKERNMLVKKKYIMSIREILFENQLNLYIAAHSDSKYSLDSIEQALHMPENSIYLGRTEDLVTITEIEKRKFKLINIEMKNPINLDNQWIPPELKPSGILFRVPTYIHRDGYHTPEVKTLIYTTNFISTSELIKNYTIIEDNEINEGVILYN